MAPRLDVTEQIAGVVVVTFLGERGLSAGASHLEPSSWEVSWQMSQTKPSTGARGCGSPQNWSASLRGSPAVGVEGTGAQTPASTITSDTGALLQGQGRDRRKDSHCRDSLGSTPDPHLWGLYLWMLERGVLGGVWLLHVLV